MRVLPGGLFVGEPVRAGGHDDLVALRFAQAVLAEHAALVLRTLGGVLGAAARFLALLLDQLVGREIGEVVERLDAGLAERAQHRLGQVRHGRQIVLDTERSTNSFWRFSEASASVRMSIALPVSCEARRTFWPRRPIASDSWSSGTTTSMRSSSSSITTRDTEAGCNTLTTKVAVSGDQWMMSINTPCISCTTACTRLPFMPTQAPTGSMLESCEMTPILAREPGSRAAALISMMPS